MKTGNNLRETLVKVRAKTISKMEYKIVNSEKVLNSSRLVFIDFSIDLRMFFFYDLIQRRKLWFSYKWT